ncbi:MAG: glycosyltransferase [Lachnospiraceae bacterium]|nr:glycosyltransferase [Candidatus Colinaster scatohippi]
MTIQTLVSGVKVNTESVAETMNLQCDSIIINQCDKFAYSEYDYKGSRIRCFSFEERGVGLSRNNALLRADADIILFSDDDIVYEDGYAERVVKAFETRPQADMLLFNMEVEADRATYHTDSEMRIHRWNCGRYPTYSFACRRECIHKKNITFNLLFGGGAKYSNGEDSLFIQECLKKGLKIYALPINIGREVKRPSTWFEGYTDKFFYDRGVLYRYLYGRLATPMALRFLIRHKGMLLSEKSFKEAYSLIKKGIREA